ncbi:hypothetical protein TSUD_133660 [Trifolium subterraneum]|uniref:RRM domain-containing protein n=1 Tax=Trifolium subterraneum TaxID=3900 RepID=A0A2Z6PG10_TRISU|nr:hypothetical protein TSUD_133660 [Trifolium subterraneum]
MRSPRPVSRLLERKLPCFVRAAQEECISFFFTNFPQYEDVAGLRKLFCSFGSVADVFIPSKRTKYDQRFGFVRFRVVPVVDELLLKLQDIWLGTYKLRVNISKFGRNDPKPLHLYQSPGRLPSKGNTTLCDGRSFVDADLITFMDSLVLHGLSDITACPMGGGLILFTSKIEASLLSLFYFAHKWWGAWFSKLKFWSSGVLSQRREVWLAVWGVPLQRWGLDFFLKIANSFGEFIMVDDNTLRETSFVTGRVKARLPVAASAVDEVVAVVTSNEIVIHVRMSDVKSYCVPSDGVFSDAGNFENGEDDNPRGIQHQNEGTCLLGLADLEERTKTPLSTVGGLSCQQLPHESNRFSALADFDSDIEEIEPDSDRRREVSVSGQFNRVVGAHPGFLKTSNQSHDTRILKNHVYLPSKGVNSERRKVSV